MGCHGWGGNWLEELGVGGGSWRSTKINKDAEVSWNLNDVADVDGHGELEIT